MEMDVCCFDDFRAFGVTPLQVRSAGHKHTLLEHAGCDYSSHFSLKVQKGLSLETAAGYDGKGMPERSSSRPSQVSVDQTQKPLRGVIVLMSDPGDTLWLAEG